MTHLPSLDTLFPNPFLHFPFFYPPMAATSVLRAFRLNELKSLPFHVKRFGALPTASAAAQPSTSAPASSTAEAEASVLTKRPVRLPNPFLPQKSQVTGRWAPAKYSLRQQAELVKIARLAGRMDLLPPGPKYTPNTSVPATASSSTVTEVQLETATEKLAGWEQPVEWVGTTFESAQAKKDVKDGGVRLYEHKKRMFKGHKHERIRPKKLAHRKELLRDMPNRITEYKQVRHSCPPSKNASDRPFYSITKRKSHRQSAFRVLHLIPSYHSNYTSNCI
jgi:large subunit ribosomal protein L25